MQSMSDAEREVMKVIWEKGGCAGYAAIMDSLASKRCKWKKNTILTLLSRLGEKGYLKTEKNGRRNIYVARLEEKEYQSSQTGKFLCKFYEGDAKGLVASLIQEKLLSEEEYEELKAFWEDGMKE